MEHRQKSLIMCVTPLQIIIAEKIIQSKPTEDFDVIIFALESNEKFTYYAEKLKKYANTYWYSHVIYKNSIYNLISFIKFIFKFNYKGFNKKYNNYYLASIDSRYFQYILSRKEKNSLVFTFDDGTANIVKTSIYYLKNISDIKKSKIFKFLGIKYFQDDIKNISKLHYTIYPDFENIIQDTKVIKLFNDCEKIKRRSKGLNVFLGQPYGEFDSNLTPEKIEKLMDKLNINLYFPHPRERLSPQNVEVVNTKKIFEDYIVEFLENNEDYYINIYTFMSSAALNVKSLDGVNIYFIQSNTLISKYPDFFNILRSHNFTILEF